MLLNIRNTDVNTNSLNHIIIPEQQHLDTQVYIPEQAAVTNIVIFIHITWLLNPHSSIATLAIRSSVLHKLVQNT
jgi:hypothetical protein